MSIIFDAIKRAEAERQKSAAGLPMPAKPAAATSSRTRLWALTLLFVSCGLAAWWINRPAANSKDIASTDVPQALPARTDSAELSNRGVSPELPARLSTAQSPVHEVDLRTLGTPEIDSPITSSAQLDDLREAIASKSIKSDTIDSVAMKAPEAQGMPVSLPQMERPLTTTASLDQSSMPSPTSYRDRAARAQPPQAMPRKPESELAADTFPSANAGTPTVSATSSGTMSLDNSGLKSFYELGYEVRHEIPPMPLSMYVYNRQAQFSFIIINGKKYTEGEQIEGKVQLQKIRADGIECEFEGTRFFYPRQTL
jgi:hypothetical protein